ncbi:Voltage-gated hydrogen channel 1 [Trichoplax sp. H2]|uniref:Hydrogen voltage-gated channel 1 n=1 Tax=Trichoplax adhaerens TaxID=10228 RepID=B3RRR8_TRIAD|nr:hypothetical protein TRIADDRAFT_54340 [Trichoplax adhaerens]EDV26917.1 hypothetical protein TRIADDRAFT_54340 [Trichoplax adhaerens]RDD43773.1 Voltage-gated hydrogen channel 1 [Trichoplax sp. H2]|eukprot:XP_002110913.1 hypothetical protein TRIADDRAFT_54340 [Trichoplax adhaerens]
MSNSQTDIVDGLSTVVPTGPIEDLSTRERLQRIVFSHKFHTTIIILVVIDLLIVIAELLIDLQVIETHHDSPVVLGFHFISISILGIFVIEFVLKIYAFRLVFFLYYLEVFDALIVCISLILDVFYIHVHYSHLAFEGIVVSVKAEMEEKHDHKLKQKRILIANLTSKLHHCQALLVENDIPIPEDLLLPDELDATEYPTAIPPNSSSVISIV